MEDPTTEGPPPPLHGYGAASFACIHERRMVDQNIASWNQLSGWLRESQHSGRRHRSAKPHHGFKSGAGNRGSLSLLFPSPWTAVGAVETRRRGFQAAVGAFLASTAASRSTALSRRRPSRADARERYDRALRVAIGGRRRRKRPRPHDVGIGC